MQSFPADENFHEKIARAKADISLYLGREHSAQSAATLAAATHVAGRTQGSSAAAKGPQPVSRKEGAFYDAAVKPLEEAALRRWAQERGVWIDASKLDALCNESTYVSEGAEQKVYVGPDASKVIKLNSGVFHGTWLEYFCRTILHNDLFRDVAYSLIGFADVRGELVAVVVEQPTVETIAGASREEVERMMFREGFIRTRNDDYYHRTHGLILEDLHDENVLRGSSGNMLFIDPVIYFETPAMGLGGESKFCFPFGLDVWC